MTEPTCPPCLLTQAERRVVAEMRKLAAARVRGGIVKARWDPRDGRWDITIITK